MHAVPETEIGRAMQLAEITEHSLLAACGEMGVIC
jgi:hypothetical protein